MFKVGMQWKEIYIISMGRVEILLSNRRSSSENYIETLYSGWVIGSYGSINYDEYTISWRAITDWVVLKLDYYKIDHMRTEFEELNENIWDWEKYIKVFFWYYLYFNFYLT